MGTEGSTVLEPLWRGLVPPADDTGVSGSATCALPPRYEAVRSAREFTRETLERWCMEGEFDAVALVVSELVTNALRHGLNEQAPRAGSGVPSARAPEAALRSPVRLDLMRWAARLVCAVRDPSSHPPEVARHGGPLGSAADGAGYGGGYGEGLGEAAGAAGAVNGAETGASSGPGAVSGPVAGAPAAGSAPANPVVCAELADFTAESGRGLRLVESFSDGWGWHPLTGTVCGKVVWALFHVDAA